MVGCVGQGLLEDSEVTVVSCTEASLIQIRLLVTSWVTK